MVNTTIKVQDGVAPGRGALGYIRPLETAEPRPDVLDATVQRTALRACARGESLGPIEIYEEADEAVRLAFAHLVEAVEERQAVGEASPVVVVATLAVLGERVLERTGRLLVLLATGARVLLADGQALEDSLHVAWAGRAGEERRRDRVREGMRAQALRGVVLGRLPFGYAVDDRVLIPDRQEAPVVQRIFREYVEEGEGLRRIAAGLNRDGIRTKLGGPWAPGSVRTILRNTAYTGLYRRVGVVVPASHPPLVDRATFGAAQRRMVQRRTSRTDQQRHDYAFAGLLRCGRCGAPMSGDRRAAKGGRVVSYRCASATSRGTCQAPGVREDAVVSAVLDELSRPRSSGTVAIRRGTTGTPAATRGRLERQMVEAIERWSGGEWRLSELVARAAPVARELYRPGREEEAPSVAPDDARRLLVDGWDELAVPDRARLLRVAIAE
ncbi:MAG: hypothetical protein DWG77_04450, partial [Chloroflexi bacterium]|nr:hypothetical protein [Chloroflexota bacterium]